MNKAASPADVRRDLRGRLAAARAALPAPMRMQAAETVATLFQQQPALPDGYVAGYWAMRGELPLHVLQLRLVPGQVWCLPCIQPDGSLRFAPWRPGDPLVSNRFGIPEPDLAADSQLEAAQMSVILLPLLGFTREGTRLGSGGGYYDRTLAFRRSSSPPPRLLGIAYAMQEIEYLAAEPWDVPMDAVITEHGLIPMAAQVTQDPS